MASNLATDATRRALPTLTAACNNGIRVKPTSMRIYGNKKELYCVSRRADAIRSGERLAEKHHRIVWPHIAAASRTFADVLVLQVRKNRQAVRWRAGCAADRGGGVRRAQRGQGRRGAQHNARGTARQTAHVRGKNLR